MISDLYFDFVRHHCDAPAGGTAGSYRTAINKLVQIFTVNKPDWLSVSNIWEIEDPLDIEAIANKIIVEQKKFKKYGTGIFAPYKGAGDSYFRKYWCISALRYFARFRRALAAEGIYEKALENEIIGSLNSKKAARSASKIKLPNQKLFLPMGVAPQSKQGREIVREVRVRCNQHVFRKAIINNFRCRCCVCGLDVDRVLDAAHIRDWAEDLSNALDIRNGLCLSATYHRAFDAHLIEIGDNYELILSDALKACCSRKMFAKYFLPYKNRRILLPENAALAPSLDYLSEHRKEMVK